MARGESWDEAGAMRVVGCLLDATCAQVDPGGGPRSTHDFDALTAEGSLVAVEVTRHNDRRAVEARALINAADWRFGDFGHRWLVDVIEGVDVRRLRRLLPSALAGIEDVGINSLHLRAELFGEQRWMHRVHREAFELLKRHGMLELARRLFDAGVRLVYDLGEEAGGEVIVGSASSAGSYSPESIVSAVEHQASLEDNASKLAAAGGRDERHLFVWVETSQFPAYVALRELCDADVRISLRAPTLPASVDAVWVATATEPADVCQYHRKTGWHYLGRL